VSRDGSMLYVTCADGGQLAWVELPGGKVTRRLKLPGRPTGVVLSPDGSRLLVTCAACASCHPDARADALNWDLMNDGVGNPKNTKSMLLSPATPPAMAEGVRPTSLAAVRAGLEHILFANRPEEEALAINEYIKSLEPVPSPRLVKGRLSPAAQRGKELFESPRVGCANCHPAPLYTDRRTHKVEPRTAYGFRGNIDTPTLVEVWRTAPYLHDGRYLTVKGVLVEDKHGRVDGLSAEEIDDLVEFVLSL